MAPPIRAMRASSSARSGLERIRGKWGKFARSFMSASIRAILRLQPFWAAGGGFSERSTNDPPEASQLPVSTYFQALT